MKPSRREVLIAGAVAPVLSLDLSAAQPAAPASEPDAARRLAG